MSEVAEKRGQAVAVLSTLTAKMNSDPSAIEPIAEAFERVLDIASHAPGGWNALMYCLMASKSVEDVLAFCRRFPDIVAAERAWQDLIYPEHEFCEQALG